MFGRFDVKLSRLERLKRIRLRSLSLHTLAATCLLGLGGCGNIGWWQGPRVAWPLPLDLARQRVESFAPPTAFPLSGDGTEYLVLLDDLDLDTRRRLALCEVLYAAGTVAARNGSCRSVDLFYGSTVLGWGVLLDWGASCGSDEFSRANKLYHSSLARLLESSQKFRRFDSDRGLAIQLPSGWRLVPIVVHSAVWSPSDVGPIVVVGEYYDPTLTTYFRRQGQGVPVVCHRKPGRGNWLVPDLQPYALTALFRTGDTRSELPAGAQGVTSPAVLEFYDPLHRTQTAIAGRAIPLASDISAPLVEAHRMANYSPVRDFLRTDEVYQLTAVGPHQRGRIPILFVHGLLSDPLTYFDMANELRGDPVLASRFEIWAFRYPTGGAVLEASASLRKQIAAAVALDGADDPALSQLVIVGHSMGGLVSKLQVTYSDDTLWMQFARRPFDQLRAPEDICRRLASAIFFRPSCSITRIVYIATPHDGSPWADRAVGRVASLCTQGSPEVEAAFRTLTATNPDVFRPSVPSRPPTSIDLLEPSNEVLQGIRRLRYPPWITVHSIVGDSRDMIGAGPSDGVVPTSSAHEPTAVSEVHVPAKHTAILRAPGAIYEVKRILHEHLRRADSAAPALSVSVD